MTRGYRLASGARYDLQSIWTFIAHDSAPAADRVMARIQQAVERLAQSPKIGHSRTDLHASEQVRFWPVGSYIIVYRPSPKPILIVRILHAARDLNALL